MATYTYICSNCGRVIDRKFRKRDLKCKNHFCCKKCEAEFRKGTPQGKRKKNEIIIKEDYAIIKIKNNLLGELDCLVDIEDVEKVKDYFWNARYDKRHPSCTVYVESHFLKKRIHLHRLVLNYMGQCVIDHINGNGLDNRKTNLRIVTQSINCLNKNHKEDVGVHYDKKNDLWVAKICINNKTKYLGRYRTKKEAIKRRNIANEYIKIGEFQKLEQMECEKIGLQRNNKTGYVGISSTPYNSYQIHYKNKYLGTTKDLDTAIKIREHYISSL